MSDDTLGRWRHLVGCWRLLVERAKQLRRGKSCANPFPYARLCLEDLEDRRLPSVIPFTAAMNVLPDCVDNKPVDDTVFMEPPVKFDDGDFSLNPGSTMDVSSS